MSSRGKTFLTPQLTLAVVFYVPYILIDVPSNLVIKHFKAGYYIPALIIGWGLVSTFMGLSKNFAGLVAARAFLGLFEGGELQQPRRWH